MNCTMRWCAYDQGLVAECLEAGLKPPSVWKLCNEALVEK
jgi:hypothetical protein